MVRRVLFPQVKWAQRKDNVFITVETPCRENMKVELEEDSLKFHTESNEDVYEFELIFPAKIDKEKSKYSCDRVVHILLVKQVPERWAKLSVEQTRIHWLKCDWDKWLDTDEEEALNNKGMGGYGDMDFSNFGGMGGMDGLGDMEGGDFPEGDDDLENESECDEDTEVNEDDNEAGKDTLKSGEMTSDINGVESVKADSSVKSTA